MTAFAEDRTGSLLRRHVESGSHSSVPRRDGRQGHLSLGREGHATVATWGAIRWRAVTPTGTTIELSTRSGNTRAPDKTWSDWSKPYTIAAGSAIESPKARYLQWRAVPQRHGHRRARADVGDRRLPPSQHAAVRRLDHGPPAGRRLPATLPHRRSGARGIRRDTSDGRAARSRRRGTSSSAPTLGRRTFQKSLQTFVWQARDADGDRLQFDVLYRLEGETTWTALKRGLVDEIYTWDTTSVPDGTYIVKVVASDAPANAPAVALGGRAREHDVRRRQHAGGDRGLDRGSDGPRASARVHGPRHAVRDPQRRVSRRTPAAGSSPTLSTACSTRARSASSSRWRRAAGAGRAAGHRCARQRRDRGRAALRRRAVRSCRVTRSASAASQPAGLAEIAARIKRLPAGR